MAIEIEYVDLQNVELGKVQNIDLGGGLEYALYVPENVNPNTEIFVYNHGSYNAKTTDNGWLNIQEHLKNNGSDSIVIAPTMWQGYVHPEWETRTLNIVDSVKNEYNIVNENVTCAGFSAGGWTSFKITTEYIKRNPDVEPQIIYLLDDWSPSMQYPEKYVFENGGKEALLENNTIIFTFQSKDETNKLLYPRKTMTNNILAEAGLNLIKVRCDDGVHGQINRNFFNNGLIDYRAGTVSLPTDGYTYEVYIDGEWKEIDVSEIDTIDKLYNYMGINYTETDIFQSKINMLLQLDSSVKSDSIVLQNCINNVLSKIKSTSFVQNSSGFDSGFSSTTLVPTEIPSIVKSFFQANADFLLKLANDMKSIAKIGASIEKMDSDLSKQAEELENVGIATASTIAATALSTNVEKTNSKQVSQLKTQEENKSKESKKEDIQNKNEPKKDSKDTSVEKTKESIKNANSNKKTDTNSYRAPTSNYTQSNNNYTNESNTNYQSPVTTDESNSLNEFPEYDQLYSTENKIVYDSNENYKIVVHIDGDKVLGVEHYYDFGSQAAAENALGFLETQYNNANIIQQDRYIKVIFDNNLYSNMNIDNIRNHFSNLNEIIKL